MKQDEHSRPGRRCDQKPQPLTLGDSGHRVGRFGSENQAQAPGKRPYWRPGLALEVERGACRPTPRKKCAAAKRGQGLPSPFAGSPSLRGRPEVRMSTDSTLNSTHLMIPPATKTGKEVNSRRACAQIGTLFSRDMPYFCGFPPERCVQPLEGDAAHGTARPARGRPEALQYRTTRDTVKISPFAPAAARPLGKSLNPGLELQKSHVLGTAQ